MWIANNWKDYEVIDVYKRQPLDRRYGSVRFHYGDPPYDGRLHDEPDESREPRAFREQAGSACERYRKNPLRHLYLPSRSVKRRFCVHSACRYLIR